MRMVETASEVLLAGASAHLREEVAAVSAVEGVSDGEKAKEMLRERKWAARKKPNLRPCIPITFLLTICLSEEGRH